MNVSSISNAASRRVNQVPRAAAEVLLEAGARQLRTAAIAERAGITESTLFRNFGDLKNVVTATEKWAWEKVNSTIAEAHFTDLPKTSRDTLLRDMSAIWSMRNEEESRIAATIAFYLLRQRREFELDAICDAQLAFQKRLGTLCERVIEEERDEPDTGAARLLSTLIANYVSVVWLTWLLMPVGSDDLTTNHDLSHDEAQIGIIMLLDRNYSGDEAAMLTNEKLSQ